MHHANVLVVGAASGIGEAVARRLHAAGSTIFCADVDRRGVDSVVATLAGATAIELDVRAESSWTEAMHVVEAAGPLAALINCAGVTSGGAIHELDFDEWRRVQSINLDGAFLATKHGLLTMREHGGVIVHVGSASGIRAAAGAAAYSTSKAALRMLVQVAAKECRTNGWPVRVNLVSPAGVKTPLWRSMPFFQDLVKSTGSEEAAFEAITKGGGGPFSEPDDVARAIEFLISDDAAHVTGIDFVIDDGYVL